MLCCFPVELHESEFEAGSIHQHQTTGKKKERERENEREEKAKGWIQPAFMQFVLSNASFSLMLPVGIFSLTFFVD